MPVIKRLSTLSDSYNDCVLRNPQNTSCEVVFKLFRKNQYENNTYIPAALAGSITEGMTVQYAKKVLEEVERNKTKTPTVTDADTFCEKYSQRELWKYELGVEGVNGDFVLGVYNVQTTRKIEKTDFSVPEEFMNEHFPGVGFRGSIPARNFIREWRRWQSAQNGSSP